MKRAALFVVASSAICGGGPRPVLTKFRADGSHTACDIEWGRARREFVCRDL